MIYLNHTEPNEIVRTLWRELGPEACLAIAITIATRSTKLTNVRDRRERTYGGGPMRLQNKAPALGGGGPGQGLRRQRCLHPRIYITKAKTQTWKCLA